MYFFALSLYNPPSYLLEGFSKLIIMESADGSFHENHMSHTRPDDYRDGFYVFSCHNSFISMSAFSAHHFK